MYVLHIANQNYSSWSLRPWLLLRQLEIPFREQIHPFPAAGTWQQFREFSPTGRVPCLHHDGQVIWDSLAIAEYLAEDHPGVWPAERSARAWARCAAAEMHSGFNALRNQCGMNCGVRVKLRDYPAGLAQDVSRLDELWSEGLQRFGGPFLAGAFSAVDAFFAPVAFRVQTYGLELSPAAADYAKRLLELPAMREWYEAALRETWREPGHEAEMLGAGELLADYRQGA